jgi:hypothetical protein
MWLLCLGAYLAGLLSHLLYQRWQAHPPGERVHAVAFVPSPEPAAKTEEPPLLQAGDVDKIKSMSGRTARIRGRVYRVGHSAKSDTYFLNFGPSRSSLTGVIFASATELFKRRKIHPRGYEGKEVEITGEVKDHPKYGLEIILEEPEQIRALD